MNNIVLLLRSVGELENEVVSINSSSNAWNNWHMRNTEPAPAPNTTTAPSTGSQPAPVGEVAVEGSISITDAPATSLVYSTPATTQLGRSASVTTGSLSDKLDQQGFFSASATAKQAEPSAPEQFASPALPEVLSQAEVIARAAYALVSEASASNTSASLVEQFG